MNNPRTRILGRLTNREAEAYLQNNDLIFVPVGTTEMHGGMPLDSETVMAEAIALKMAEAADGLVLTGLPYFYAGATLSGRGTVQVSVRGDIDYLYELARSLLRQGFRRQVYVSAHGPAGLTISPVVRDFFETTQVPILYIDLARQMFRYGQEAGFTAEAFHTMTIGAYAVMGRLADIPLTSELDFDHSVPEPQTVAFANGLFDLAFQSGSVGYYFGAPSDHMPTPRIESETHRQALADTGCEQIDRFVALMDVPKLLEQLTALDRFTKEQVLPKYGDWLQPIR